ncbi:MAG: hypothetical protein EHM72_06565 [Calditrichaeota bacterium]|nr:MAG: hypothetical protein EHM72_06565 [Calditrichota bacterium]
MQPIEKEKLDLICQFSQEVSLISDPAGFERHFIESLKKIIPCNTILIFHNDLFEKQFIAKNPYNPSQTEQESVSIAYEEAFVSDILMYRKSFSRQNPLNPVLPSMKAELFIPLFTPDDVLGCLYVARSRPIPFQLEEIRLIEQAACHATFALERRQWRLHFRRCETNTSFWKDKYITTLQAIPFPAVVVNRPADRFEEANDAALSLYGGNQELFIDLPVSHVIRSSDPKGIDDQEAAIFITKKNEHIPCMMNETVMREGDAEKVLIILMPRHRLSVPVADGWLSDFARLCANLSFTADVVKDCSRPIALLAERYHALYVTLQTADQRHRLTPLMTCEITSDVHETDRRKWNDLYIDFFQNVFRLNQSLFLDDVEQEDAFKLWLKSAQRLDYRSVAALLMHQGEEITGIICLFCRDPQSWTHVEVELKSVAIYMNMLLARRLEHLKLIEVERLGRFSRACAELPIYDLSQQELWAKMAVELRQELPFDLISMSTLVDPAEGEHAIILCTQKTADILGESCQWHPVEGSELGWLTAHQNPPVNPAKKNTNAPLSSSLHYHFSTLVMKEKEYLGNLSLGRISGVDFSAHDRDFIKQAAGIWAGMATIHRRFRENQARHRHMNSLVQINLALIDAFPADDFLHIFLEHFKECIKPKDMILCLNSSAHSLMEVFQQLPSEMRRYIREDKAATIFQTLAQISESRCYHLPGEFLELCDDAAAENGFQAFVPFVLAPLVHDGNLYALLFFEWDTEQSFTPFRETILQPLLKNVVKWVHVNDLFMKLQHKAGEMEHLLAVISHDFKTPLQNLRSFVTLLANDVGTRQSEQPQKYLLRMMTNLEILERMIVDLLNLYQIGKLETFNPVNLGEIIRAASSLLSRWVDDYGLKLNIPDDWPVVIANSAALMQVFTNLLLNGARFACKNDQPRLVIGYADHDNEFEFFISDNGPGIPPGLHAKVFELFYKGDQDTAGSTGMGLAIVKHAVLLHRGRVWVESVEGKGATFKFTLPKALPTSRKVVTQE